MFFNISSPRSEVISLQSDDRKRNYGTYNRTFRMNILELNF